MLIRVILAPVFAPTKNERLCQADFICATFVERSLRRLGQFAGWGYLTLAHAAKVLGTFDVTL